MKERNEKRKPSRIFKDRRLILSAAMACAAIILAIVFVTSLARGDDKLSIDAGNINSSSTGGTDDTPTGGEDTPSGGEDKPIETPTRMIAPIITVDVSNDYGFFHNKTLGSYYHHDGVDFIAAAGTEVLAVEDGTVESVYSGDLLLGTEIVVDHGNGVKSVYRFVNAKEGLKAGDSVKKGEVIATVAEATGEEYKDGAHLHFEILENGKNIDPASKLELEEK